MIEKKNKSFLIIEVPPDIHTRVKICAVKRNISMTLWLRRLIVKELIEEEQYEKQD